MKVAQLSVTPVKGTRLTHPDAVDVGAHGLAEDRRFHVVVADDREQLGATKPALVQVVSRWDPEANVLALAFPDGRVVEEEVELGADVTARITWDGDRAMLGRALVGPWSDALSAHLGVEVVLARPTAPRRAIDVHPVTLVSRATLAALGIDDDPRRFRLNVLLDGLEPYEEETWDGRTVQVGDCVLRVGGPVPRCAAINSHPESGDRDARYLKVVAKRPPIDGTKAPLGVYATVERPGRLATGDPLALL